MDDNTNIVTGGVSTIAREDIQITDLAPNNYLTIVWQDSTGEIYNTLDYNEKESIEYLNSINSSLDNAIQNQNVTYRGQNKYVNTESIAKYISQNKMNTATKKRVANALINLASGKSVPQNSANLLINVFGEITKKTARDLGYTDPHNMFSGIMSENTINVLSKLGQNTQNFIGNLARKITRRKPTSVTSKNGTNPDRYIGLLLGMTTNDTETYEVTIPRKKVEEGSDYTTHLLPQRYKKDFTVNLTNKVIKPNFSVSDEIKQIEAIKDKLIEIANSHTLFDIYIRLSKDTMYKRKNVSFTSLSFTKDENSGNGYTCSFTVEPVSEFKTKVFVSSKQFSQGSGSKTGTGKNRDQSKKDGDGKSLEVGFSHSDVLTSGTIKVKNLEEAKALANRTGQKVIYSNNKYTITNDYFKDPKSGAYVKKSDLKQVFKIKDDMLPVYTRQLNGGTLDPKNTGEYAYIYKGNMYVYKFRSIQQNGEVYYKNGSSYQFK